MADTSTPTPAASTATPQDVQEAHFQAALSKAIAEAPPEIDPDIKAELAKDASADPAVVAESEKRAKDVEKAKEPGPDAEPAAAAEENKPEPIAEGSLGKARRLFADGDISGALKTALGVDVEALDGGLKSRQWKALVARERAVKAALVEADQRVVTAEGRVSEKERVVQQAAQQLQPLFKAIQAYHQGDVDAFIQQATGDSMEKFQRRIIAQMQKAPAPAAPQTDPRVEARLRQLEQERQTEKTAREAAEAETRTLKAKDAEARWVGEISQELAEHPQYKAVATKKAFLDRVLQVQRDNYNPKTQMTLAAAEAAELAWEELYGGVIDTQPKAAAPAGKGAVTGRGGLDGAGSGQTTSLKHSQASEAAPDVARPWSIENQQSILDEFIRKEKTERYRKELARNA